MAPTELERQSFDDSYSTNTSPSSKTNRRTSSFNGWLSIGVPESLGSDVGTKSFTTNDSLNVHWSSSGRESFPHHVDTKYLSPERKIRRQSRDDEKEDRSRSMPAIELEDLIRQLSFSPSQQTKKRTDTADTVGSSSFDSSDAYYEHTTNPVDLELKDSECLRRCPSETSLIVYFCGCFGQGSRHPFMCGISTQTDSTLHQMYF
eukprot:scaffold686_cov245-Skeletonema_marinoi.AAC.11